MNLDVDNYIADLSCEARDKALVIKYLTNSDLAFFAALHATPRELKRAKNLSNKRWAAGKAESREIHISVLHRLSVAAPQIALLNNPGANQK